MSNKALAAIGGLLATVGIGSYLWKHRTAGAETQQPSLVATSPKEGDYVSANSIIIVQWDASGLSGNLSLYYHIEGEDDPFWIDAGVSPDVQQGSVQFIVPDKLFKKMSLFLGVWDWDAGQWIVTDAVDDIRIQ